MGRNFPSNMLLLNLTC